MDTILEVWTILRLHIRNIVTSSRSSHDVLVEQLVMSKVEGFDSLRLLMHQPKKDNFGGHSTRGVDSSLAT